MQSYFLQANLYLLLFYVIYVVFLDRETFFKWNRAYLLLATFVSLLIPVVPLTGLLQQSTVIQDLQVLSIPILLTNSVGETIQVSDNQLSEIYISWLTIMYLSTTSGFALRFFLALWRLQKLVLRYGIQIRQGYYWVQMTDHSQIFSFLNCIFWGSKSELNPEEQHQITQHELAHIKQWHSLDIILLEWLQIVFWFNPVCYLMKYSMRKVHEYLADDTVLRLGTNKQNYATLLIQQSLLTTNLSLSNTFFNQTLLKSRIKMMNQKKSQTSARLKFAFAIPTMLICILVTACSKNQFEDMLPKFKSKVDFELPEESQNFKVHNITSKSLNKYKYIFAKERIYSFDLAPQKGKTLNPNDITVNVYLMKMDNTIDKLVASNVDAQDIHTSSFKYEVEKTAFFVIEIQKNNATDDFIFLISTKSKVKHAPPRFAEVQQKFPKSEATKIIDFKGKTNVDLSLKKDRLYHFFLNTPIDPNREKVMFYIIDWNNSTEVQTQTNYDQNYDFKLLSVVPNQHSIYKLSLETNADLENYEVLVFSQKINK